MPELFQKWKNSFIKKGLLYFKNPGYKTPNRPKGRNLS